MFGEPDGSQQVEGEIVIDMTNGDVWGFPTLSGLGLPYPAVTRRAGGLPSRNRCISANLQSAMEEVSAKP
jgi:hypothetical protein